MAQARKAERTEGQTDEQGDSNKAPSTFCDGSITNLKRIFYNIVNTLYIFFRVGSRVESRTNEPFFVLPVTLGGQCTPRHDRATGHGISKGASNVDNYMYTKQLSSAPMWLVLPVHRPRLTTIP